MEQQMKEQSIAERIGISTNLFLEEDDTLAMIRDLANQFNYVEIELEGKLREQTDEARNMEMADEIRKIGEETGATLNLHAPYIRVDFLLGGRKEEARETILRSAEFAIRSGSKSMTFHPGFRYPKNASLEQRQEAVALTQELAMDLFHVNKHRGSDMLYCLENMGDERPFLTFDFDEHEEIFTTSPVSLTLDMAHIASYCETQEEARAAIQKYARYAGNVHLADVNFPKHLHLPLGAGDFDYHSMVLAIEETGYRGPYIVEEIAGGYPGEQYLSAAKKYQEALRKRAVA